MAGRRQQLTDEQRAVQREQRREEAEKRLDSLLNEEGWAAWLRLRRNVHSFSWANQILILQQATEQAAAAESGLWARDGWANGAPDTPCGAVPRLVKAAWRWKRDGHHPAKGTRALYVWVFKSRRRKDGSWRCCGQTLRDERRCPTAGCAKADHYFQLGPVFDASQVVSFESGEPPVLDVPRGEPLVGDSPGAELLAPLAEAALAADWCAEVRFDVEPERGEGGWFRPRDRVVAVCLARDADGGLVPQAGNAQLRTLIHELAHAKGIVRPQATADGEAKRPRLSYADEEVAVECVSYIVAATAGLDTSGEAIPYMASWGGEGARAKVRELASLIDRTAKEIEEPLLQLLADRDTEAVAA